MIKDKIHTAIGRRPHGFTVFELMIVLLIIGILVAFAYPSYLKQVRESKRAVAKNALLNAANREEQYFFDHRQYADEMKKLTGFTTWTSTTILFNDGGSPIDDGGSATYTSTDAVYAVSVAAVDDKPTSCGGAPCYQLQAVPQNDQAKDACYTFTLRSDNHKDVSNTTSTPASECW